MITKPTIFKFLQDNFLGVLSTVDAKNMPDAAPIYFEINENFEVFFITSTNTKKYINLLKRKHAVLTVTNEKTKETVQVRGVISEQKQTLDKIFLSLEKRVRGNNSTYPVLPLMENSGQKTVLKLTPKNVRMRSYGDKGIEEEEIDFKK